MMELMRTITVGADHPSLPGHFPGHPIVPGVLLLDLIWGEIDSALGPNSRLVTISSTKFSRAVRPDEVVDVTIRIDADLRVRFTAKVDGVLVSEGAFTVSNDRPERA